MSVGENNYSVFVPYSQSFKKKLERLQVSIRIDEDHIRELSKEFTDWSIQTSKVIIEKAKKAPSIIGFYGQSVSINQSSVDRTVYLGNAALLNHKLKTPVVSDFHNMNSIYGENVTFLEAAYYQSIIHRAKDRELISKDSDIAILDISNKTRITVLNSTEEYPVVFELSVGLGIVNDFTQRLFQTFDTNGQMACRGEINSKLLNIWADECKNITFLSSSFGDTKRLREYVNTSANVLLPLDGIATLITFIVQMIEKILQPYPNISTAVLIGNGAKNHFLRTVLSRRFNVLLACDIEWNDRFSKSEQAAYNALRYLFSLPILFPNTTGTYEPSSCGRLTSINENDPTFFAA
jgi:anhydro-N-acetylmuramic acid kinase